MPFGNAKSVLGLDIGRHSSKAVVVRPGSTGGEILARHCLDCRAEGLLDDPDAVIQALPEWLSEHGLQQLETSVCIPQYLGTVQVSDFPPAAKASLHEMVAYETQQVAGLSEEGFLHDHSVMPPGLGKQNPVVIGIAKSSVVDERVRELAPAKLKINDLSLAGIALANAYFSLAPEDSRSSAPQLLLDIGAESTTLVIVAAGQILSISSLLFGSQRYTQDLARHLDCPEDAAEEAKRQADLETADEHSPLWRATRQLESEIHEAVQHWRSQEDSELCDVGFQSVNLCGGGAKLKGLAQHLGRRQECPGRLIGLPDDSGNPDPETVIAYGTALQGAGCAALPVSLRSASVASGAARRANLGALVAALIFFVCAAVLGGAWKYRNLRVEEQRLSSRIEELKQCERLIPKLDTLIRLREHRERTLLPIVAKANRANRILDAIEAMSEVRGREDWFIYLADKQSYQQTPGADGQRAENEGRLTSDRERRESRDDRVLGFTPGSPTATGNSINPEFPSVVPVTDVEPMRALVAAGFSKYVVTEPYRFVRRMVDRLNGSAKNFRNTSHVDLFKGVDLLPNQEIEPEKQLFRPWLERIKLAGPIENKYKPFMLKLPFAKQPVSLPKANETEDK